MKIIDGIGKAKGLPLGLYLIIQNEEDHNAELDNVIITETPLFDAEQNIYLYDIRLFPKWNRTIWFSFRPEVVYPLEIVLLLGICTCLCLFGVRLLRPLGLMSVFLISGLLGMKLGESVTKEFIWMMVFYTTFAFLGVGIIWILLATIGNIIKRMSLFEILRKQMCWLIPILAGLSGAYIIFTYVSNTWWFYVLIPMIVMLLGEVIQYRRKDKMKVFHTYEDLIKLSIVSEDRADGTVDSKLIAEGENNA